MCIRDRFLHWVVVVAACVHGLARPTPPPSLVPLAASTLGRSYLGRCCFARPRFGRLMPPPSLVPAVAPAP
eukprot:4046946-Alexandrium_andersonii.AAC.1